MNTKLHVLFFGWIILITAILALPERTTAQDVYFSISGTSATVSSGDDLGQYDYWFRPKPGVSNPGAAVVEIFDAGLGGFADVVIGDPSTRTTYALYPFDDLYILRDRSLSERGATNGADALEEVTAFTESRFLNRWVPFFELSGNRNDGYIMRVHTDDGNDVNDFQIRITGPGADDWELITLNLSVGLISSMASNQFQFRPLWGDIPPPEMEVQGHEDSIVFLIDAFSETRDLSDGWEDFQRQQYRKDNRWGVIMTGSRIRINNRVLRGRDQIVPFYFDPVVLSEDDLDTPDIQQLPFDEPTKYGLRASYRGTALDLNNAEWFVGNREFTGPEFSHDFGRFGTREYRLIVPVRGRHFPQYLVMEGELHVNTPPVIEVEGYQPIVSPGENVILDASDSYDPDGRDLEYQWYLNDVFRSSSDTFVFNQSVSGRYHVRLTISDNAPNSNFTDTTQEFEIVVNTQPYAEIDYKRVVAESSEVTFRAKNVMDADGDDLRFIWRVADREERVEGEEVTIFHEEPGYYRVFLTVDDQTGTQNARYETDAVYKVNAAPVPVFSIPEIVAPNDEITLDGTESYDPDEDSLDFRWVISDGRRFEGAENTIRFNEPGSYTIALVVDDGEGVENSEQRLEREIRVNEDPVPVVEAVSHTNNARVEFDARQSHGFEPDRVQFIWDFGDGNAATGSEVTHTYDTHGEFTVTLTVDDGTGLSNSEQSVQHRVRINKNPVAVIQAPEMVAPGRRFVLDGRQSYDEDGRIVTYEWFRNGRKIGDGPTLEKALNSPGRHHITLVVRDDSPFDDATGSETVEVKVNHPPVVRWHSDQEVSEPGRRVRFDASDSYDPEGEELSFRWAFSDGRQFTGTVVERTFDHPGTVEFTLYADDGKGLDNSTAQKNGSIRINQSPVIVTESTVYSNSLRVSLDASESFDPDEGGLKLAWRLPDGSVRNETAFDWIAPETGTFRVLLTADDGENLGNSVVEKEIEVVINRPPVVDLPPTMEACADQPVSFTAGESYDPDGGTLSMHWDFGDGNTSSESEPEHVYRNPGHYQAILSLRDGIVEQPSVGVVNVYVEGTPQARIAQSEITVCANTAVQFDGSDSFDPNGMVGSYSWDFGGDGTAVGARATHMFREPGTYEVSLTITGAGSG
ncbi:PKD domain-containing protein, partial [Balneolaceae bacterium ANBcel3]|nr:PKD domain-containing protein [Balneolaceae bacterium ANBcel3]